MAIAGNKKFLLIMMRILRLSNYKNLLYHTTISTAVSIKLNLNFTGRHWPFCLYLAPRC